MKNKIRLWQFLLVSALFWASCQNHNFVVDPASVCHCDAGVDDPCFGSLASWSFIVNNLLEVSAGDFTHGDFVGTECEGEVGLAWEPWPFYFNSWRPVDGFKHNMSGTLHHFNWNYDDDEDWNIHIIPNAPFTHLITDVEALHDESADNHIRCGNIPCMEAEISPDKQFWTNPWFFKPGANPADTDGNGYSWLEGRQMGYYGLWIMDANHDFKSEIHPSEMMWFKDHFEGGFGGPEPFDIFWLMFMQDNTGRFDDRDNFDCGGDAPTGWEPWSQSPRSGQFNIAFEVDPASEVVHFSIVEIFKRFVVTSQDENARRDADDGVSHGLEYNGKVVVQVEEDQPNDDDLGVTFTNVCLRPDGKLQGFVSLRSKIGGNDDKDEEGFHILYATRSLRSTRPEIVRPDIAQLPALLINSQEVPGSLKGNDKFFMGDLQLSLSGGDSTKPGDYEISKIEFAGQEFRREVKFKQNKPTKEGLILDLPLTKGGSIIVTTASGLSLSLRTPAISLYPRLRDSLLLASVDTGTRKFLSASVGGVPDAAFPEGTNLMAFQEFQLSLSPLFAAMDGEQIMTDKASSYTNEINQAILENDPKKLEDLFQSSQPFTIEWAFEAISLTTGKPVPVYPFTRPRTAGVLVEQLPGKFSNDVLKVTFLSRGSSDIIEFRARATVRDSKGRTALVEHKLWSHGFQSPARNVEECASLIQALSGLKDRPVLFTSSSGPKPRDLKLPEDPKARNASMMNAYSRETVRDGQITLEELRNMIRAYKKFSEK